tara:strand:- start:1891 stop:2964 length:1074 start_codon:yes stop_codon:yes gene_type:complete
MRQINNFYFIRIVFCLLLLNFPQKVAFSATDLILIKEKKIFVSKQNSIANKDIDLTNSDYILGPGDELELKYESLNEFNNKYSIGPDGNLFLPRIGSVMASGSTLKELTNKIELKYEKYINYPKILINVISYGPLKYTISGQVASPGYYESESSKTFITLFDAIKNANGLTKKADLTNVKISRNIPKSQGGGKKFAEINLLEMFTNGNFENNIGILSGDSIFIPEAEISQKEQIELISKSNINPSSIKVFITGQVNSRGAITIPRGSSLNQALAASGGFAFAKGPIHFTRILANGDIDKRKIDYSLKNVKGDYSNPIMMAGDIINVRKSIFRGITDGIKTITEPIYSGFILYEIFDD